MSCEQIRELISADLDGELQPTEEAQLWPHLSDCEACRSWRRDQLQYRSELHQWPQEELPASIAQPSFVTRKASRHVYHIPRVWAWAAVLVLFIQGAVTVVSLSTRHPDVTTFAEDPGDAVETITLTADDRVRYTVQTVDDKPKENPTHHNGG